MNPPAVWGMAKTSGTPFGLLCAPDSTSHACCPPSYAGVAPQPPGTSEGLDAGLLETASGDCREDSPDASEQPRFKSTPANRAESHLASGQQQFIFSAAST